MKTGDLSTSSSNNFLLENKLQFPPLRVYEDPIFLLCTLLKAKEYYAVPDVVYRYNGTHSNKRITLACTKDYLRGHPLKASACDQRMEENTHE